jgi:beta-phosphoglucomutase-like phosphatase (HAD superfamily)
VNIFLSHSLSDKDIAEKLRILLKDISFGLITPWLSSSMEGLKPGDILWDEIHDKLKTSDKIISILTRNSLSRPWILYESGYVAGNKGAKVIPLLFNVQKESLPLPLSAYMIYSAENKSDLLSLLLQLVSEVLPNPNIDFLEKQLQNFQYETKVMLDKSPKECLNEKENLNALGIKFIDKIKASEIFHKKISDSECYKICIITYTNEVEAGAINRYHIQGKKEIEVFKRSFNTDLSEQQIYNILRLQYSSNVNKWNKFKASLKATVTLEDEFHGNNDVKISQYFYDSPPQKRAYLFNDNEAIIGYYETVDDYLQNGGSIYKGMNKSQSMWIDDKTELGKFMINEMINLIKSLKITSRCWEKEKNTINDFQNRPIFSKVPCVPKAVFLDMDGVLYDSLPNYVKSWKEAFNLIGIDLPEIEVYRQEGRQGKATVELVLEHYKISGISNSQIESILNKKAEVLQKLEQPVIQYGAKELVEAIMKSHLEMWVVTGSTKSGVRDQIVRDFYGCIPASNIITGDDYSAGKPSPVPYLIAAQKAKINPSDAIVIENAPLGIESAEKSGAFCIAVNTGILNDDELNSAGAKIIFKNCQEIASLWPQILNELRGHL